MRRSGLISTRIGNLKSYMPTSLRERNLFQIGASAYHAALGKLLVRLNGEGIFTDIPN